MRKWGMASAMVFSIAYHHRVLGYLVIGNIEGEPTVRQGD